MTETLVIALGGNAITRPGERGTIPQQFAHTAETLEHLVPLFRSDRRLVITHGNGPQIGNILIRSEEGERRVPPLPLDTCVSDSQGGMGYMIQRVADEMFRREGIRRECATVITQVVVDRNDPDFSHPSKPVGSFHSPEELEKLRVEKPHWRMKEIEPSRWRRVVPSPRPLDILEKESIAAMLEAIREDDGGHEIGVPGQTKAVRNQSVSAEPVSHGAAPCMAGRCRDGRAD